MRIVDSRIFRKRVSTLCEIFKKYAKEEYMHTLTKKLKNNGIKCPNPEGIPQCDWVIVDAGSIIIHLFRSEIRKIYNLEKLWGMSFDKVENKLA